MLMASRKPFKKIAPRIASSSRVTNIWLASQSGREWIVDEVRRRVGGRKRHGDDEVGGGESEQGEDEDLAAPLGEEPFQHRDAALAVRAGFGDAAYRGSAANRVTMTRTRVANGESTPAARKAMPGWYPRVEK